MPSKVLWGEGLFLRPQHFQQQDRYHEARLNQTACALHPYAWGVRKLVIDHDALRNDLLRIEEVSLLFPDGEVVRAPDGDVLPLQVRLGDLPPEVQTVTYHAALPILKAHGDNCAIGEEAGELTGVRYARHDRETQDLYTQAAEAPVTYLRKALRLVPESEALEAFESFPLVRLRRVATGGFEPDPSFMPPCLAINAVPALQASLARLMEKMLAKVNALYGHLREPSRNVVEIRGGDMSSFWLLHTASAGYAELSHLFHHRELHPERLFATLLSLAGGLMTYSRSVKLEDLPSYVHADPGPQFARLDGIIRELLDTVISSRYFTIALRHERSSYYLGRLDSGKIDAHTTLYLAVSADMPALQLVEVVPLQFKVGAPQDVDKFVLSALPGVKLVHAPQVPAALPVRPDTFYFVLENRGTLYEAMLKSQAISIYVPDEGGGKGNGIRDLHLELMAVAA
ncbi:type VI secretion system baseplate subunit TssK [Massilia sp. ZL223]|nr:type VI secretion system baseplate subunit TssK [Massilia sp. ZL223]MBQ5965190.1 type VI secretion system baseplate subunit TssK [Massilia sp. ZL223]